MGYFRSVIDTILNKTLGRLFTGSEWNYDFQTYPAEFAQTGSLPYSSLIKGHFFRWHNRNHLWTGKEFWKTFEDGPWKWEAPERYAGRRFNCAHYFALTSDGAKAEANFYGVDTSKRVLLEIEAQFDPILNLTYELNLRAVTAQCISDPETILGPSFPFLYVLDTVVDVEQGGNAVTDMIGRWAFDNGYMGIMYFSARTIDEFRDMISSRQDFQAGVSVGQWVFNGLRDRMSTMNLAIFSGSALTGKIVAYRTPETEWLRNPYFGVTEEELDKALTYGREYQQQQYYTRLIVRRYPSIQGGVRWRRG